MIRGLFITAVLVAALGVPASAIGPVGLVNGGFEYGDLTGWDSWIPGDGSIAVVGPETGRDPVEGDFYAVLAPFHGNDVVWLWQDLEVQAGDVISGYACFEGPAAGSCRDWGEVQVQPSEGPAIMLLHFQGVTPQPWTYWQYEFPEAGTYRIQVCMVDAWNTAADSRIGVDGLLLTTQNVLLEVGIDVRPGSDANPVNTKSRGLIPVAILGSADLDVGDVAFGSLRFGPGEAEPRHARGHYEDVNGDGYQDLVAHFPTRDAGFAAGDTEARLTGETVDGTPLEGTDTVRVK